MSSPYAFAAIMAAFLSLGIAVAFFIWRRRYRVTPPSVPPAGAAAPVLSAPPVRYPFDDEWKAHAPYPDHALHAIRPEGAASRHAPSFDTRTRPRESFEFDDVEPFDLDESPPFRRADRHTPHDPDCFSFAPDTAPDLHTPTSDESAPHCPHCRSPRVETLNVARKAGGTIGSVAGATGGMAMALSGAEAGAAVGAIGGPIGSVFGGLAGAVIAGLLGSAAGCAAGSAVGSAIDDAVLDNYRCRSCGHAFGTQHG